MLLSDDHSYFKSKLIDVGNGRFSNAVHSRSAHQLSKCSYKEEDIVFICDQMYMVESQTQEETFYMVDMRLNHCDCPAGSNKGTCKHKIAVMKFFNCAELSVIPINDYRSRSFYHFLATEQHQDPSFYRELNQIEVPNDIEQYIEDHRANVYEDPAILEEVNQDDNDSENEGPILSDLEVESESDSDDENEIWESFKKASQQFENRMKSEIHDKSFKKCLKKFTKNMEKVTNFQPENLKQHPYSFGQFPGKSKKGSRIPVQPTAVARRKHPQGGRAVGMSGRRVQDAPKRMRMEVTETEEIILALFPNKKIKRQDSLTP